MSRALYSVLWICCFQVFIQTTLIADINWRLELYDGSIFWTQDEPIISGNTIEFQVGRKTINSPLLDVVSLKHLPKVQNHWLYQKGEGDPKLTQSTVVRVKTKIHRGSGVIIHSRGFILTNYHLIKSNHNIEVTLNNEKTYSATVFAVSELFDLAVLKLDSLEDLNLDYASIGDDHNIPSNSTLSTYSTSQGLPWLKVSGSLKKDYEYFGAEDGIIYQQIQLNIAPDNSGSPVFNQQGQLVGILTKHLNSAQIKGIWFSIPSGFLKIFFQSINGFVHDPTNRPVEYLPIGE